MLLKVSVVCDIEAIPAEENASVQRQFSKGRASSAGIRFATYARQGSDTFMMYDAYQGMADVGDRVRLLAQNAQAILTAWSAHPHASPWRRMSAYYELVALAGFTHARPDYGIDSVEIDGAPVPVEERGVVMDAVLPVASLP